ncbi:MAG: type I-C CRISPR-associated endonuclease Cas1 [Bryobacterales bacterium]|nr:type I-C CRISPR-associated endonuclease Cas1 [Bryobacterales bacterium]
MKKLLNSLFVTKQGVYLAKDGECVAVKETDANDSATTLLRIPIHTLESVLCFGRVSASPPLMGFCGENGVLLSFFTEGGRFLARVQGPVAGNILLRRQQYRMADGEPTGTNVARSIVIAKVANSRFVLQRAIREQPTASDVLATAVEQLGRILERLRVAKQISLNSVRGMEGEAARNYFGAFNEMIVAQQDEFVFKERSRRPPLDRVNAVMSFLYTLLAHDCVAALEGVGLDAYCGYLHVDRPGRPSLALDLMEEFRSVLADRMVLTLINRRQLRSSDFDVRESGAVWLNTSGRKTVITAWQERKKEKITHPIIDDRVEIGLVPHVQALLLARHLRGDIEGYPSLLWR